MAFRTAFRHSPTISFHRSALVRHADAEADTLRRLARERAVDSTLADSIPASDPPSWTFGIPHAQPEGLATPAGPREGVGSRDGPATPALDGVIDVSRRPPDAGVLRRGLVTLVTGAAVVLAAPVLILLIGVPIAVVVGGVVATAVRLIGLIVG